MTDHDESGRRSHTVVTVLLVLVIVPPLFWVGFSLHWIYQRHVFLNNSTHVLGGWPVSAPALLWVFGEQGSPCLAVFDRDKLGTAERLFPESQIEHFNDPLEINHFHMGPSSTSAREIFEQNETTDNTDDTDKTSCNILLSVPSV